MRTVQHLNHSGVMQPSGSNRTTWYVRFEHFISSTIHRRAQLQVTIQAVQHGPVSRSYGQSVHKPEVQTPVLPIFSDSRDKAFSDCLSTCAPPMSTTQLLPYAKRQHYPVRLLAGKLRPFKSGFVSHFLRVAHSM